MVTFHAIGNWGEGAVGVEWTRDTRPRVPEVEAAIDRAWAEASARPGVHLFDGPMCRLERWHATDERLALTFSPTSYKPFLGTNLTNPTLADRFGPTVLANPAGASVVLESADGYLLLGRRTAAVAYYPGRVHPFAGALEPRDGADVFATVRRELAEELRFEDADVERITCLGVIEDGALRQPELIFHVRTARTRAAIGATVDQVEHHATYEVAATRDGVERAVSDPALTPVAVGSLLLWGRNAFGNEWFQSRREET